ncbi:hypothetical protein [Stappia sp. ES.058]|uniref:hypothetical protein n=1 Tax=Stappia sp. ES.058 TaxID=1881061 RepID=UPI00087C7299|nr:hypothetical protein [Stappia sp. ES.058]SDU17623.1 hypothetical protein SAMN05428979_2094 [Stappia sp. ES.058]
MSQGPAPNWIALPDAVLDTASAKVDAFARALAGGSPATFPAGHVPATYAFTVFAGAESGGRIEAIARERGAMLVHQAQAFTYHAPLERDRLYAVSLDWHANPERDDRLVLRGRVHDGDGPLLQEFTAEIVLFVNRKEPAHG